MNEGIGEIATANVYYGWREAILKRREKLKRVTLKERSRSNRGRSKEITLGELRSNP
jgi:hypothetical protein